MSITSTHTGGPIVFNGTGAFTLAGIEQVSIDPGCKDISQYAAGQPDPSFVGTMENQPMVTATCTDLAIALGNGITPDGLPISSTSSITSIDVFSTLMAEAGLRAGSGAHFKTTISKGIVIPKSIKCTQGQRATMDIECHGIYDGTNQPFIYTDSVSIVTPEITELFTIGKVMINGTELSGVTSISVDFGIQLQIESATGQPYPTFVGIKTRAPRIDVTTKTLPSLNTFGLAGTAQGSSSTCVYFQKMANNGTRVAAATAQHIKLSLSSTQGLIYCKAFGGSNNASHEGIVSIVPNTGTSTILTISSASAIS
jgi:hypothetical protein